MAKLFNIFLSWTSSQININFKIPRHQFSQNPGTFKNACEIYVTVELVDVGF